MEHNLFKPQNFEQGRHAVVGDCNNFTMEERYKIETPLFAREIVKNIPPGVGGVDLVSKILDYGVGVGRLAKGILSEFPFAMYQIVGVDASTEMMKLAEENVNDKRFTTEKPQDLTEKFDLIYLIYVLQHCPAVEIREVLQRIYFHLKDDGVFIYCSSDYRMSIRFDGQGFFDDRFLGVNLREEIERYFDKVKPLFNDTTLNTNPLLGKMIRGDNGGLAHPAFVYRKKKLVGELFNAIEDIGKYNLSAKITVPDIEASLPKSTETTQGTQASIESPIVETEVREVRVKKNSEYTKLILTNRLAPGDILVMTNCLRDLHKAYPGKYQVEVRSPCNQIFENNPYVTKLQYDENEYQKFERELHKGDKNGSTFVLGDILVIDAHYPIIHESGEVGWAFGYGHTMWLEEVLGVPIKKTSYRPEIYLSQAEQDWISPVLAETGYDKPYWVLNAGSKGDYTLKQWPYERFQEVVDILKDRVQFVQAGLRGHSHVPLKGVIDMVGKTADIRKFFRVVHGSLGVVSCVSFLMHTAAALRKPAVIISGAREGPRWEEYGDQQFLYVTGCLPCSSGFDGCWKSKIEDCTNKVNDVAKCLTLITSQDVVRAIERYYDGGKLTYDSR